MNTTHIPIAGGLKSTYADDPLLKQFVPKFIANLPGFVGQILDLLDQGKLDELEVILHRLKGAGGGYGFSPISEQAAAAERSVREAAGLETIQEEVDSLVSLTRTVKGYDPEREKVSDPIK